MSLDFTDIPDFSGDDFAKDKSILEYRAQIKAYEDLKKDVLSIVKTNLDLSESGHINLKTFVMFKSLQPIVKASYSKDFNSCKLHVSLVEYHSDYSSPRFPNAGNDDYLFGLITGKTTFPKTYICKESIREKIYDLFMKQDVDFKDSREFSRKFYVISEDKKAISELLKSRNLDSLGSCPDMEIEFNSNRILFRSSRKSISIDEAEKFSELANKVAEVFS